MLNAVEFWENISSFQYSHLIGYFSSVLAGCNVKQELIRRWDSERELFYDDIAHLLQNTKKENLLRLTN